MRRRFLLLYGAAIVAIAISAVGYLALRFETIRLGYEVAEARREERKMIERRRELELEAASLKHPRRIEVFAREALSMEVPSVDRIVPVEESRSRIVRPAGRAR